MTTSRSDVLAAPQDTSEPFQARVALWMDATFGPEISADRQERAHRFLEEALELVQSTGTTESEARQLVAYVFGRPAGEPHQEVGGVEVTFAAFCLAHGIDKQEAGEAELARVWTKVEQIRAKQAAKPKHSPLPEHPIPAPQDTAEALAEVERLAQAVVMTSGEAEVASTSERVSGETFSELMVDRKDAIDALLAAVRALADRATTAEAALASLRAEREVPGEWRDMSTAPKNRVPVLLRLKDPIPNARPDLRKWDGLCFVGDHPGMASDGFDIGWRFAAPIGQGGFPDEWFQGWRPLSALVSTQKDRADGGKP